MSCNRYDNILKRERNNLRYPLDTNSLYANKIYDNQTAYRRAYTLRPIEIVEGFGYSSDLLSTIIKWLIVLLIIYIIVIISMKFIK